MSEKLENSEKQYESIAKELEAAQHFHNKEVPRGTAHAYAGWGHINKAEKLIKVKSITLCENSKSW